MVLPLFLAQRYKSVLDENRLLLRQSYRHLLSENAAGLEKAINSITATNLDITRSMRQINPHWNPNWLWSYLKLLVPYIGQCARATMAEKKSLESILKRDKKLGKWDLRTIGMTQKEKMLVVALPNPTKYPDPFNHRGPLSATRYAKYKNALAKKLHGHGLDTPFLTDYLSDYLLDAPLYAYEAVLLKEADATPI